jgi:ribosomal protein S18 acetylase RimI-like enzyme
MRPAPGPLVRPLTDSDLDFAARLTAAEGWLTETREEFEGFLAYDRRSCFLAEIDGRPAAVCASVAYGSRAFIGEMIVDRRFRGRGLGPALFGRVLESLDQRGCRSVSLDAVPRAASFYGSLGFRALGRSFRLKGALRPLPSPDVRPMTFGDLEEVTALDREAFGADRSFFLKRRFRLYPDLCSVQVAGGSLTAYLFGRRRGPLVWAGPWWVRPGGGDPSALLRAFGLGSDASEVLLGILETHPAALALVRSLGFQESPKPSIRMARGDLTGSVGLSPALMAVGSAAKG